MYEWNLLQPCDAHEYIGNYCLVISGLAQLVSKNKTPTVISVNVVFLNFNCCPCWPCSQGTGRHPAADPWGRPFSKQYFPKRFSMANRLIAGGYVATLEAIQADQDFVRILFQPDRFLVYLFTCLLFAS